MEKVLKDHLREGEKVLWEGKTEVFPLLDNVTKFKTLAMWIATVAVVTGVLAMYITRNETHSMGFIGLMVVIAVLIVMSPILERRSLLGQKYWLTDQRAIMLSRDKTFYYMEHSQIDVWSLNTDQAAYDCLALGSCIQEDVKKQLRWRACHPKIDLQGQNAQDNVDGLIFYCVGNAEGAVSILKNRAAGKAA